MQSVRVHAALLVGRYDLDVLAQPEQPAGDADGDVCVLPARTRTRGAPCSPCSSTSQPASCRTACRAAARQVTLAIWPPVTNPTPLDSDTPRSSRTQAAATSSTTDKAGDATNPAPF
jgi:hypothetical protein